MGRKAEIQQGVEERERGFLVKEFLPRKIVMIIYYFIGGYFYYFLQLCSVWWEGRGRGSGWNWESFTFPVGFYLPVYKNKMLSAISSCGDAVHAYKLQGAMVIQTQPFHPVLISWYYVNW